MADTRIGILQYIKGGEISVDHEISNLKAGRDINIKIRDFFSNSPDYQKLQAQIQEAQSQLDAAKGTQDRLFYSQKVNDLLEFEKEFKADVLQLANTFSQMELRTERLRQAAELFDQGRFKDADAILKEEDLANDQHNLLIYLDYLEARKDGLWKKMKKIIDDESSN